MKVSQKKRAKGCGKLLWVGACALTGFLAIIAGSLGAQVNHTATGLALIGCAVAVYLATVLMVAEGNWLDIRAVFSAAWLFTIGCAALRWAEYQKPWERKTWLLLAVAYSVFFIGATAGISKGAGMWDFLSQKVRTGKVGRVRFALHSERLYAICVVTTLIGLLCFGINVAIRGFIPCFSNEDDAYLTFYTKFHVFAVAATSVSGLCYYCIKTQPLKKFRKAVLLLCIFYLVFLFPILVVSRGTFVTAAVSLMVAVFYLNRKKLLAVILSLALIFCVYMGTSLLRGYTNNQLKQYFEPVSLAETTAAPVDTTHGETELVSEHPVPTEAVWLAEEMQPMVESAFTGPAQVMNPADETAPSWSTDYDVDATARDKLRLKTAFVYSYLTVSHDNFNEAVKNVDHYTYGTKQFAPFNVLLRSQWVDERNAESPFYKVKKELNTVNLVGDFYYDFGGWGVAVCTLLWAFVFGMNQAMYERGKNVFALLMLGNTMVPVALCFFSNWLSIFSQWMLWGTILLFALAAYVYVEPKTAKKPKDTPS